VVVEVDGILVLNVAFSETAASTPTLFPGCVVPLGFIGRTNFWQAFFKVFYGNRIQLREP
jgi:hypothetical protein